MIVLSHTYTQQGERGGREEGRSSHRERERDGKDETAILCPLHPKHRSPVAKYEPSARQVGGHQ